MNLNNVRLFPVWKKGETAAEFLGEMAMIATQSPQRFAKVVVIYEETLENGNTMTRQHSNGCTTNELIGIIEMAKHDIMESVKR